MSDWIETPESSNVARFCYIEGDRVLSVEFKSGATYNYYNVPDTVFEQMRAAGSKGQFLDQNVKGVYRYARV
jgi:KTSC domain-containing protein